MPDPTIEPDNPNTPVAAAPPVRPPRSVGPMLASALALAVAVATWLVADRRIGQLQHDLAALQDAHQQLAVEVTQGRKGGGGAVGEILDIAKAPARGRADAVVTLVEFSDYECPFCIRHFQQTMPLIDENYIDTNKIRYVFRDFPIDSNHPEAIKAHEAARCALEQDKFWNLHPRLFSAPGTHTPAALQDRAKEAGLNPAAFDACIASGRTTSNIRQTAAAVDGFGITGTPWFFVGLREPATDRVRVLKAIGGAQPFEQFAIALDAAIKEAGTR